MRFLLDLDTSGRCAVIPTFEKSIISWIPDDDAANDLQSYNLGGASNAACPLCFEWVLLRHFLDGTPGPHLIQIHFLRNSTCAKFEKNIKIFT